MKRSRFSEEQVTYALRQAESGTAGADVCRQLGVSEATFYVWKKKYGHLGSSELRRLRQLEEENGRQREGRGRGPGTRASQRGASGLDHRRSRNRIHVESGRSVGLLPRGKTRLNQAE